MIRSPHFRELTGEAGRGEFRRRTGGRGARNGARTHDKSEREMLVAETFEQGRDEIAVVEGAE